MDNTDPTIIIIAGDSEILDILIDALSRERCNIYLIQSHMRAVQSVVDMRPDIVLLDALPAMPRMELCRSIAAQINTRETSIIVITEPGATPEADAGLGASPGSSLTNGDDGHCDDVDYIEKPVRISEAIALIRAHIELRRLTSELRARDMRLHQEAERRMRAEKELDELTAVVRSRAAETLSLQPSVKSLVVHPHAGNPHDGPIGNLSRREYEVLQFLIQGLSSVDIGRLLHLSDATVRTYRSRIMQKLKVDSFAELIKMSIQWGIA